MSDTNIAYAVRRLDAQLRPIVTWPGVMTGGRTWSRFRAELPRTLNDLRRELGQLDADHVVLQLAYEERDLRMDGLPRAHARLDHQGVVLSFDSRYGPLQYATDEFHHWHDNLRAIALSMEALRAVDRYGVSRRGEQYVGWRAIPARTGEFPSREEAQRFLEQHGGFRAGARRYHPDNPDTGDEAVFKKLVAAKELVA